MKKTVKVFTHILSILFLSLLLSSCKTKALLSLPKVTAIVNTYEYTIQPMDEDAKCDNTTLTASYDGFNIIYGLNKDNVMKFFIENKTNKYLIIDKSKCYVIYDGFSRELFKDVRSGRSTTYNNVQDAISSVSTNESSITLSIPPYSKWELPVEETNVETVKFCYKFYKELGSYSLTPYTTNQTIEFVIPYSWDYSLSKWATSRNRLYVGNIKVEERLCASPSQINFGHTYNSYTNATVTAEGRAEYDRVARLNDEIRKKNLNAEMNNELFKLLGLCVGVPLGVSFIAILIALAAGA